MAVKIDEAWRDDQSFRVKNLCAVLQTQGVPFHYHEYHGGHDLEHWRAELDQALRWLLSHEVH